MHSHLTGLAWSRFVVAGRSERVVSLSLFFSGVANPNAFSLAASFATLWATMRTRGCHTTRRANHFAIYARFWMVISRLPLQQQLVFLHLTLGVKTLKDFDAPFLLRGGYSITIEETSPAPADQVLRDTSVPVVVPCAHGCVIRISRFSSAAVLRRQLSVLLAASQ